MPLVNETIQENKSPFARLLLYGPSKTKKTWWLGTAAEAGYNVLLMNGDDGAHILNRIAPNAQHRIRVINCMDQLQKAVFYDFVIRFLLGDRFIWDDETNQAVKKVVPEHNCFIFDSTKLTANDVVCIDSWTALMWSLTVKNAAEKGILLEEGDKGENPWELYGDTSRQADWILNRLKSLPCNVVVIAHSEVYEKTRQVNRGGKKETEIIFTRIQPISSSRPHAQKLAKLFSDVLFFKMIGNQYRIDASADEHRDGGSRILAPKNHDWDELHFGEYAKLAHIPPAVPDASMPAAEFVRAGSQPLEVVPEKAAGATNGTVSVPVLQSQPTTKPGGLLGLVKKGNP